MVIAKYVTNQPMAGTITGMKNLAPGGMSGVLTATVAENLSSPRLIYFELRFFGAEGKGGGDHHFCAFGLDDSNVVAAMGWQDLYTFADWFRENEGGVYKTEIFLEHLKGIEAGSTKSVIDLCAYLGEVQHGPSRGRGVISALTDDLAAYKPTIKQCLYFDLP